MEDSNQVGKWSRYALSAFAGAAAVAWTIGKYIPLKESLTELGLNNANGRFGHPRIAHFRSCNSRSLGYELVFEKRQFCCIKTLT